MIRFLLQRSVSVVMIFGALVIMGCITYFTLPVSLLPDISIPEITVKVTGEQMSTRELENTVVTPIRSQLLQVGNLRNIESESRDGAGSIRLKFDYGTNTDLAFIEVNEKIDASMNSLPRSVERPRVIKASATDIPVFYINLTLKDDVPYKPTNEQLFLNLSDFAINVVKRRIEQLPEVAMADITGIMHRYIQIIPNMDRMESTGFTFKDIERTLAENNFEPGSMVVREGYYEYNIKFSTILRTVEDVRNIYLRKGDRILQLKDLATIQIGKENEQGISTINGKQAVTLAVIKQADETMDKMKQSLNATLNNIQAHFPDIEISVNRNQTVLLDYTISNLSQNLLLGFLLVFVVALLFLGDVRSPIIIGISILCALVVTFLFFYLFKQSLNIITLSGLILALGMMIDSSIIVTDIISQYRERGYNLSEACIKGTNEVITPILSSTLTTIVVFVPLVFMSGIAGAIFFAQAFSVSVGLLVSYFTGIILLPVIYRLIYSIPTKKNAFSHILKYTQHVADRWIIRWYDIGFQWVFHHKAICFTLLSLSIPLCILMFHILPQTSMPYLRHNEIVTTIEWNENIHLEENHRRTNDIIKKVEKNLEESAAYIGIQQYLIEKNRSLTVAEAEIYFRVNESEGIDTLQKILQKVLHEQYPKAVLTFTPTENIFSKIFDTNEPELEIQLYPTNSNIISDNWPVEEIAKRMNKATGLSSDEPQLEHQLILLIKNEKMLLYGVRYQDLLITLRTLLSDNKIATLRSFQQYLPISLTSKQQNIEQILRKTLIESRHPNQREPAFIPLQELVHISHGLDLKAIVAGKNGEYLPFRYNGIDNPETIIEKSKAALGLDWDSMYAGSYFSNKKMIEELVVILLVSIVLMYFILSAQFGNFLQPIIVLVEIPVDIGLALVLLWATGHTLNLMSAIGLIVTSGIIINDSILKLDMINELRKEGTPLLEAIHMAGIKRLRAIIMTTLTTIFAMVPLLFTFDLGSELQKPLAIAMIGTMLIGVLVSLFILPLIYWAIYRKQGNPIIEETVHIR